MKISKSKQELARIISENGGWRDGAEFSAQDKDGDVFHYSTKPTINAGREVWHHKACIGEGEFTAETLPNWHQSILSRDEYFHLYPAPDADGWIEWKGGECPVEIRTVDESGSLICDEDGIILESFSGDKVADYTLHATNSHDELVAEVERLMKECNQLTSQFFEADAMVQEMQGIIDSQ